MYPKHNQLDPNNPNCEESSAYPNPDSEYGWESSVVNVCTSRTAVITGSMYALRASTTSLVRKVRGLEVKRRPPQQCVKVLKHRMVAVLRYGEMADKQYVSLHR